MNEAWYVVQTQPQAEEKARRHLINQGIMTYLPRYRRRIRHARQSIQVLRPLFPGYLFVRLDPSLCRWRSINGTMGVRQILTDGELPLIIGDLVIQEIMSREDGSGAVKLEQPMFAPGQTVRVTDGPLADLEGLFEEVRDHERAVLLISWLGRKVRAQVPLMTVVAA